jgi:hypothetical protein
VYDLPSLWQKVPCGIRQDKFKNYYKTRTNHNNRRELVRRRTFYGPGNLRSSWNDVRLSCWPQPVPYRFNRCMFKVPCHYVKWAPANMQTCDHPLTVSVVPTQICNFLGQIWQWLATSENFSGSWDPGHWVTRVQFPESAFLYFWILYCF